MNTIKMKKFGKVLTGRDFGRRTWSKLSKFIEYPVILDFSGVMTVVLPLATALTQ